MPMVSKRDTRRLTDMAEVLKYATPPSGVTLGPNHVTIDPEWDLTDEGTALKAECERKYAADKFKTTLENWFIISADAGQISDGVYSCANRVIYTDDMHTSTVIFRTDQWAYTKSGSLYKLGKRHAISEASAQ